MFKLKKKKTNFQTVYLNYNINLSAFENITTFLKNKLFSLSQNNYATTNTLSQAINTDK